MKELNSNRCSLEGAYLIEASAGTGKTYNIQNIAVRLIVEKNLKINEILIVTFTRAATAELSDRIRGILQSCADYLALPAGVEDSGYEREKEILRNVLGDVPTAETKKTVLDKISAALLDFDENAISTIDSFCQRMLSKNAFESGILFQSDIIMGDLNTGQIHEMIRNEWRKICYDHNNKYAVIFRNALRFDFFFQQESDDFKEEFQLTPSNEFYRKTIPPYFGNYAEPGNDFAKLVENKEVFLDLPEPEHSPEEIAEHLILIVEEMKSAAKSLQFKRVTKEAKKGKRKDTPEEFVMEPVKKYLDVARELSVGWQDLEGNLLLLKQSEENLSGPDEELNVFRQALQRFSVELMGLRTSLLYRIRKNASEAYFEMKRRGNLQTFHDLQMRMIESLEQPDSRLEKVLKEQFKAAVIDEFQDTDQNQSKIFFKVFPPDDPATALFLVGDPKQAIYAFRGGDIFSYKSAAAGFGEDHILSLNTNYRSADALVESVNKIFSGHNYPFADPMISFTEVMSSGNVKPLQFDGVEDSAPFHYLSAGESVWDSCVEKICHLLEPGSKVKIRKKNRSGEMEWSDLQPSDIAILLRSAKYNLPLLTEKLRQKRIPYVTIEDVNLYDTQEARDVEKFLHAVLKPTDIGSVTRFMQTALADMTDCRTLSSAMDPADENAQTAGKDAVAQIQEKLSSLQLHYEKEGIAVMFREFLDQFHIHSRYPALPAGDQKYSNLIRLRDILVREELKNGKSLRNLALWYEKQLFADTRTDDEENMILSTDAPAVRIMTVHKSKGLQFPVVFLPDLADFPIKESRSKKFHDPENEARIIHRITNGDMTAYPLLEALQEELRIVYVAFTRAINANYLLVPPQPKRKTGKEEVRISAMDWLYSAKGIAPEQDPQKLIREYLDMGIPHLEESIGLENIETIDLAGRTYSQTVGTIGKNMEWNHFPIPAAVPRISYSSAHKYYSRLSSAPRGDDDMPGELETTETVPEKKELHEVFTLPKGDLFGIACHKIMEYLDFRNPGNLEDLIRHHLAVVNIGDKVQIAKDMFQRVITAPVPLEGSPDFTLSELALEDRCAEMNFDFKSNRRFDPEKIGENLNRAYENVLEERHLEPLSVIRGQAGLETFYTGSVDMVFRHNGKYYIVDWKTDVLGKTPESFEQELLFPEVWNKFYLYQSLLYSAALIRFLALRLNESPQTVYDNRFGGVRYLFLRGMDPAFPGRGVYQDKPDFELIRKIAEVEE